jgi:polysaccharide chain length determinant protein (PEP-CTERM system associated)
MKIPLQDQALPYLRQLWRYKWLSIGVAWLVCAIGWPFVAAIPPKFEASTRIYVNADGLLTPLLQGLAVNDNPARQVEFVQNTILSRANLKQIIKLANLDRSLPVDNPQQAEEALYRKLAHDVSLVAQTGNLITIRYINESPSVAMNVTQALLTVFSENTAGGNRNEMENAKRFIDKELKYYEDQLRAAEGRRAEFHQKYMELLPALDGAVSRLDGGRDVIAKLNLDVADARSRRDSLQSELASVPKTLSVDANGTQVIIAGQQTGYRARLDSARSKLEDLRMRFTDQHPDIISLQKQIVELEAQAAKEKAAPNDPNVRKTEVANPLYNQIKVQLVDAETALTAVERRLKLAEDDQARLERRANETPGIQAKYADLDRDYSIKKRDFEELLTRREQMVIAEAADTSANKIQFRVIDPPQVPPLPTTPNRPLLLSGVLIAAMGAAVALPIVLLQFDKSFNSVAALRGLGVPILGSISRQPTRAMRRRNKIEVAAVCAGGSGLLAVYAVLLLLGVKLYGLGLV